MDDCHDWFAEVAETWVRYLVARAGFEVFGQSEWGADLAVRDRIRDLWLRAEVRSTDSRTKPSGKGMTALQGLQVVVDVALRESASLHTVFVRLEADGRRSSTDRIENPTAHDLAIWLRDKFTIPSTVLAVSISGVPSETLAETGP